ncbi:hypothetical protein FJTKL_07169 [Diaporthe vaccinii]|uniref:Uncharacterized protein n=1 Tax=Diaporthe vaccinii TaxID=105482 RepID=A0ABR4DPN2_9PEZI
MLVRTHTMNPIDALKYLREKVPDADQKFLQGVVGHGTGSERGLDQEWLDDQVGELVSLNQPDSPRKARKRPRDGDDDDDQDKEDDGGIQNRKEGRPRKTKRREVNKIVYGIGGEDIVDGDRTGIEYYLAKNAPKRTQHTKKIMLDQFTGLVPGLNPMTAGKSLSNNTVIHAYVELYDWRTKRFNMDLEDDDTSKAIQLDDSVADEVVAAKRYLRRRVRIPVREEKPL